MDRAEISQRFDPVDMEQMRLLASVPPGRRIRAMLDAADFVRGIIRGRLRRLHPDATDLELGRMLLEELERADRTQGRP